MLSHRPASPLDRLGGSEGIRPRTLVLFILGSISFLFFFLWTHANLFPASLGNSLLAVPYRALLDSPGSVVSFFCGIFAVRLPGIPSVASAHSVSTWSRALSLLGIRYVLQDLPEGLRILFNPIATPLMLSMVSWFLPILCSKLARPSTTSCGLSRSIPR